MLNADTLSLRSNCASASPQKLLVVIQAVLEICMDGKAVT